MSSKGPTMSSNSCSVTRDCSDSIKLIVLARRLSCSLRTWFNFNILLSNISRAFCILPCLSASSWSIFNSEIFLSNLSILVLIKLISSISFNNAEFLKTLKKNARFNTRNTTHAAVGKIKYFVLWKRRIFLSKIGARKFSPKN